MRRGLYVNPILIALFLILSGTFTACSSSDKEDKIVGEWLSGGDFYAIFEEGETGIIGDGGTVSPINYTIKFSSDDEATLTLQADGQKIDWPIKFFDEDTLRIFTSEDTATAEGITLARNKGIVGNGDDLNSQIIGQWNIGSSILEFSDDNEIRMIFRGEQNIGVYKIIGNNKIQIDFLTKEDDGSPYGGLSSVELIGDEIIIMSEYDVIEGHRVK